MGLLAVFDQHVRVSARSGAIVLLRGDDVIQSTPLHEVDEVHLHGGAELTVAGRNLLLARGVDVVYLTMDGRLRGRLVGAESAWGARRLAQYRFLADDARRLQLARALVVGKIANQAALLTTRQRYLRSPDVAQVILQIRAIGSRLDRCVTLDAVRGAEGLAAQLYFGVFGVLLTNPAFCWNGRNRRPPKDPVNAALSYLYTLLVARVEMAVRRAGLDPYLGVLHEPGRGAPALALDLAEEFRPLADGVVLNLFNRRQLGPEDFGPPDVDAALADDPTRDEASLEGAVYLGDVGRKVFTRAWAMRLLDRAPHPGDGRDWSLGALFGEQAHQARRIFEGEATTWQPTEVF